jgi:hypothetical protein
MKTSAQYSREWRAENPDRVREYKRRYQPEWRKKNPDKVREYRNNAREYEARPERRERVKEIARRWRERKKGTVANR